MNQHKYDIVISFAGEDRGLAEGIARGLKGVGRSVFYDKYEEDVLWGKDLFAYLGQTYKDEAKFCLMLISKHYALKQWTNHERKAAQSRAFSEEREYILPVRLDDTHIEGMFDTVGYIDGRSKSANEIVDLLDKKLGRYDKQQAIDRFQLADDAEELELLLPRFAKDISMAYGYYLGQAHTLEKIAKTYQNLKSQVRHADYKFSGKYSRAIQTIDALMGKNIPDQWNEIKNHIQGEILKTHDSEDLTESMAQDFIEVVLDRAEGNIDTPILETLLMFFPDFQSNPEREFTEKYRYRFFSDGSGKAKGVSFSIEIPKTWQAQDANRPNIVKKFINLNGKGNSMVLVIVKEVPLPEDEVISESTIEEMLADGEEELLPNEFECLQKGKLHLEGFTGYWIRYKGQLSRVRTTMTTEGIMYGLFLENRLLMIQGQILLPLGDAKISIDSFAKYEKTFDLVANSVVLEDVYK